MSNALIVIGSIAFWGAVVFSLYAFTLFMIQRRNRIDVQLFLKDKILTIKSMSTVTVKTSQLSDDGSGNKVVDGRILPKNKSGNAASVTDVVYASSDEMIGKVVANPGDDHLFSIIYGKPGVVVIGIKAKSKAGADLTDAIEITFEDDSLPPPPPVDDEAVSLNAELIIPAV